MLEAYRPLLLVKFAGVLLFAGGAFAALLADDRATRQWATHRPASLGLLLIWCSGFALAHVTAVPLNAPWIIGGFVTSLAAHIVLTASVRRDARRGHAVAVALLLLAALALMIWRPQS